MLNNKNILITGATGSFGQKFVEVVLKKYNPKKIIVYSRDELKQLEMQKKFPHLDNAPMRYFLGDIRDKDRLIYAFNEVDVVIHAAALKQVPAAEYNPSEVIKTNILGAQNIIDAALSCGVKKVIALSTDKAAAPINLYGATKLVSDKLFVSANHFSGRKKAIFSVVRYGNVFGSRGSVIPYFLECENKGYFPVTDEKMTRFSILLEDGANFVINCLNKMLGGEIFIPKIPSYNIIDVAKAINKDCKIKIHGIRPGEKLHEEMITVTDAMNLIEYKDYYVMLPSFKPNWSIEEILNVNPNDKGKICKTPFSYNSGNNERFLTIPELKLMIDSLRNG